MLAAAIAMTSSVASAEDKPAKVPAATCEKADAQRRAGLLDEAQKTYAAVLATNATSDCALPGLDTLAADFTSRGAALSAARDLDEAKKLFRRAILLRMDGDATAKLRALQPLDPILEISRSDRLSRSFDAAHFAAQADADPFTTVDAPTRTRHLEGPVAGLLRARRWAESWLTREPVSLGLILVSLFALTLVGVRRYREPILLLPKAEGEGDAKEAGADFASNVRSRIFALTSSRIEGQLRVARGPVQPEPLAAKIETNMLPASLRWLNIIPTLLGLVTTQQKIAVSARLHPRGARGVGVTMEVTFRGRTRGAHTLWLGTYVDVSKSDEQVADDYVRLAEYAALWLLGVLRELGLRQRILGSESWEAAAALTAALEASRAPDKKAHLRDALKHDPGLFAAKVNFAKLIRHELDGELHALDILRSVVGTATPEVTEAPNGRPTLEKMKTTSEDERLADDAIYVALYQAADISFALGNKQDALEYATRLNTTIAQALNRPDSIRRYAKSIAPQAKILQEAFATDVVLDDDKAYGARIDTIRKRWVEHRASTNPFVHYNLACAMASLRRADAEEGRFPTYEDALDELARALRLRRDLAEDAAEDSCFHALSNNDAYKARFRRLVNAAALEAPSRLTWMEELTPPWLEALRGLDIGTPEALAVRAAGPNERNRLAVELHVSVAAVTSWAFAADLLRVASLDADGFALLRRAKIERLDQLRGITTADLAERIERAGATAPDHVSCRTWLDEARELTSLVR